jgi:hypothetical protein
MTITRESKLYFISKNKGCQLCEHNKGMSWKHIQSSSSVFFFWHYFLTNKLGKFRNFFCFSSVNSSNVASSLFG